MTTHQFGGDWTEDKLTRLQKYLQAYTTALSKQTWCKKMYVDAFAGTGFRKEISKSDEGTLPIPELTEPEVMNFLKGSAYKALETEPAFDRYVFIDRKAKHVRELENLKVDFPHRQDNIVIEKAEANQYLQSWCTETDWKQWRAVVFLDPYGMQVKWKTLEFLAATQSIDLLLLFPLGQAVNRVLTNAERPPKAWAEALTRTLGTEAWQTEFYQPHKIVTLFGEEESDLKIADYSRIAQFFIKQLKLIFPAVASNPLPLYNSHQVPLYLLCFASANPGKGGQIGQKIAQHILKN